MKKWGLLDKQSQDKSKIFCVSLQHWALNLFFISCLELICLQHTNASVCSFFPDIPANVSLVAPIWSPSSHCRYVHVAVKYSSVRSWCASLVLGSCTHTMRWKWITLSSSINITDWTSLSKRENCINGWKAPMQQKKKRNNTENHYEEW